MSQAFVVRIKPNKVDRVPEALAEGCLIVGWEDVPQVLNPSLDWVAFRNELAAAYFPNEKTLHKAASATKSLWNFLRVMKPGDIALVPHLGRHIYAAKVIGEPRHDPSSTRGGFKRSVKWLNEGKPFRRDEKPLVFRRLQEQPTCYTLSINGYAPLAEFLAQLGQEEITLAYDLEAIVENRSLDATTRAALIEARVGQGEFRRRLLVAWDNACAVTACGVLSAIRASHVKPWRMSSNDERLDPHNGLPLLATLDALFDAELISFDKEGMMLVADELTPGDRAMLGLPARLRKKPSAELDAYLEDHRRRFYGRHRRS